MLQVDRMIPERSMKFMSLTRRFAKGADLQSKWPNDFNPVKMLTSICARS